MKEFLRAVAFVVGSLLIGFALFACATPTPVVVTKTVNVAVPTPCKPDLGVRPPLMTSDQIKAAVAATPVFDDKIKILTDQLLLHMGWVPVLEKALTGCEGVPTSTQ